VRSPASALWRGGSSWIFALAGAAAWLLLPISSSHADSLLAQFEDPEDHAFDASEWLLDRKGFLPVPIVITEPAVGYGGGVALIFFRESIRDVATRAHGGKVTPPNIYGAGAAWTENGTKGGGAAAMLTFKDDRWRYRGAIGKADVHLDFYGIGGDLGTGDLKIGYSLDGWASSQQVLRRIGNSDQWLAVRSLYLDLDSKFDTGRPEPVLPESALAQRNSGLGLSWEFDTRDNIFTPSRGFIAAVETLFYEPDWGSDHSFQAYRARVFAYFPLGDRIVLGARLDGRTARGDVPFYQLPYIDLRGIPAARYQDENTAVAETELRWNVTSRWSAIGFLGAGRAWGEHDDFGDASTRVAKGGGFRYLIARRLGLYIGADYGWGPDDDDAFYLQVGNGWR
jgi:hypothetical protein